ncbi:hypothetical protein KP509_16G050500 [Ceratopteris richardii]|nr:hypothetical protein KP509_16G050500 [Ceratopteris richardii]
MSLLLVSLVAAAWMPQTEAARSTGMANVEPVEEVADLSLDEQQQVLRLQEDMEAAKRHLLMYDPYYNKWYGGKH